MKIAGFDYMSEQNNRLRNQLLNFDTAASTANQAVTPGVSPSDTQAEPKQSEAPELSISKEGSRIARTAGRQSSTSNIFPSTDFSTDRNEDNQNSQQSVNGNSVLNQYRFFVQTSQYEGTDGIVKRIFR